MAYCAPADRCDPCEQDSSVHYQRAFAKPGERLQFAVIRGFASQLGLRSKTTVDTSFCAFFVRFIGATQLIASVDFTSSTNAHGG